MRLPSAHGFRSTERYHHRDRRFGLGLGTGLLALAIIAIYGFVVWRFGVEGLPILSAALLFGGIFIIISFQQPQIPLMLWLLSLLGFREFVHIPVPGLPDLTLDRITLAWVLGVFCVKTVIDGLKDRKFYTIEILMICHAIYLLFSILQHNPNGYNGWSKSCVMPYIAFFLGKHLIADEKWIRRVFLALLLANIYYSITSIAEHFDLNALVYPKKILDRSIGMAVPGRSRGIFLQSAVNGCMIGFLLTIHVYYLQIVKGRLKKILIAGTLLLAFLGLFFTYTRGSWLAGAAAFLTMGLIGFRVYSRWIATFLIGGVMVLGLGIINPSEDKFFQERVGEEGTVTGRINTALTAIRMWRDHPVFGVGYFRYLHNKDEYQETVEVPLFGTIRQAHGFGSSLHDIYLGVLAEEGLLGLGLQIAMWVLIFREFRRKFRLRSRGDHFAIYMMPALGGIIIGYFVGGVAFDYRFFTSLPGLFYFVAGILHGYQPLEQPEPATAKVVPDLPTRAAIQ